MRNIDSIIVHCSATKAGQDFTAADIDCWHRERGFNGIGYHYVIRLDGKLEKGRDVSLAGAHCRVRSSRRRIGVSTVYLVPSGYESIQLTISSVECFFTSCPLTGLYVFPTREYSRRRYS